MENLIKMARRNERLLVINEIKGEILKKLKEGLLIDDAEMWEILSALEVKAE